MNDNIIKWKGKIADYYYRPFLNTLHKMEPEMSGYMPKDFDTIFDNIEHGYLWLEGYMEMLLFYFSKFYYLSRELRGKFGTFAQTFYEECKNKGLTDSIHTRFYYNAMVWLNMLSLFKTDDKANIKIKYSLIPLVAVTKMAELLTHGESLHPGQDWHDYDPLVLKEKIARHFFEWFSGKEKDEQTGESPLIHLFTDIGMLIDIYEENKYLLRRIKKKPYPEPAR